MSLSGRFLQSARENLAFAYGTTAAMNLFQPDLVSNAGDVIVIHAEHPWQTYGEVYMASENATLVRQLPTSS